MREAKKNIGQMSRHNNITKWYNSISNVLTWFKMQLETVDIHKADIHISSFDFEKKRYRNVVAHIFHTTILKNLFLIRNILRNLWWFEVYNSSQVDNLVFVLHMWTDEQIRGLIDQIIVVAHIKHVLTIKLIILLNSSFRKIPLRNYMDSLILKW